MISDIQVCQSTFDTTFLHCQSHSVMMIINKIIHGSHDTLRRQDERSIQFTSLVQYRTSTVLYLYCTKLRFLSSFPFTARKLKRRAQDSKLKLLLTVLFKCSDVRMGGSGVILANKTERDATRHGTN